MTIKDYITSKPDNYTFEILYHFTYICTQCRKVVDEIDEEYSSGISSALEFREDVTHATGTHYSGYDFVYNDFEIGDTELTRGDEGQEVINIYVDAEPALCDDCRTIDD